MKSSRRLLWLSSAALVGLAMMMVALIVTPARVWNHPTTEAVYHGFDPNLMYLNAKGNGTAAGRLETSTERISMTALPGSQPTVDLVTSALSFDASMNVRVTAISPGGQLSIGIWSPTVGSGYFLEFGPSPANEVTAVARTGGHAGVSLADANARSVTRLGTYVPGRSYRVLIVQDKMAATIAASITESNPPTTETSALAASASADAESLPELFTAFRPTLTASLSATFGTSSVQIENLNITLPSQPKSAGELVETTDDTRTKALTIALGALGGLATLLGLLSWIHRYTTIRTHTSDDRLSRHWPRAWQVGLGVVAVVIYFTINGWLFHLGTPHFDIFAAKMWSYIASSYNYADLYHRPLIVPAAGVEGGIPFHEASFPYGPTKTYYYLGVGWLYRVVLARNNFGIDTFQFEVLLKSLNVAFGLLDAVLIYLILSRAGLRPSDVKAATLMFVLNPTLMFIMSIWGSTETISLFFMLLSIWFALKSLVPWAWVALSLGAFTRPQMLVLAFLLACVYLRKFPLHSNLRAISWSVITFFVLMLPLSIAISPSFPLDYVTHVIGFQLGTGQADNYSAVSPGYYSVWTLPLLFIQNQHGIDRMWYPRTADLVAQISYSAAATTAVVVFLISVGGFILIRRPRATILEYLPIAAFGMFGWLMLSTSLISRYFLYGVVLLILCRRAMKSVAYYVGVIWLSLITLITSWGHFGLDLLGSNAVANPLNPLNSSVTRDLQSLFFNDRFITEATVVNLILLIYLGIVALRGSSTGIRIDESSGLKPAHAT